MRPRALDLFCGAGGVSMGLYRAGFDVVAVDIADHRPRRVSKGHPAFHDADYAKHFRFVQADALTFPLDGFDFIWASPPCQAHTALRHLHPGKTYPDLIAPIRERLQAQAAPWCIENVPGAPLGSKGSPLVMLCGTMFPGLVTPDGSAELQRHRWFETSWPILFRPQCQHGGAGESLSVCGTGLAAGSQLWAKRAAISVVGPRGMPGVGHARKKVVCVGGGKAMSGGMMTPQGMRRAITVSGHTAVENAKGEKIRQTYTTDEAWAAMGIDWMTMRDLSQAIPPAYSEWIGLQALELIGTGGDQDEDKGGGNHCLRLETLTATTKPNPARSSPGSIIPPAASVTANPAATSSAR